jgi:hypothetical protein
MPDEKKVKLRRIELLGANAFGIYKVHQKVPDKIRREIGEEKKAFSVFLDRNEEEKGQVTLFAKNSFIMKEIITDNDHFKKLIIMEEDGLETY